MEENEVKKSNQIDSKHVFAFADLLFVLSLLGLCVFEVFIIKRAWDRISFSTAICLILIGLLPFFAILKTRIKMRKKLKAGEISPSYASDLSVVIVFLLWISYFTFVLFQLFVPQ
jgi:hypothetical protein